VENDQSFEAFFEGNYRRLVRSLAVASGNEELAKDVVQQAFVQLWADWPRVSRYQSPADWVARVAISRLRDQQRSLRRFTAAVARVGRPAGEGDAPFESGAPSGSRSSLAGSPELKAALLRLPLQQRVAVVLFYLDDRSVAQVAKIMGVSEGTVNRHLFRARETLRSYLQ
jgi:RNA polymerase sigma factor (sigma-70 family)